MLAYSGRRRRVRTTASDGGAAAPTRCSASATCPASPSRPSCRCSAGRARRPSSCWAGCPFPRIGELPYFVTLAPYGFYWFELVDAPVRRAHMIRLDDRRPSGRRRPRCSRPISAASAGSRRGAIPSRRPRRCGWRSRMLWAARRPGIPPAVARHRRRRTEPRYQLLIGERPVGEPAGLPARPRGGGPRCRSARRYFYDATLDSELALGPARVVSDGAEAATLGPARDTPSSPTPRSSSTIGSS